MLQTFYPSASSNAQIGQNTHTAKQFSSRYIKDRPETIKSIDIDAIPEVDSAANATAAGPQTLSGSRTTSINRVISNHRYSASDAPYIPETQEEIDSRRGKLF